MNSPSKNLSELSFLQDQREEEGRFREILVDDLGRSRDALESP